MNTTIQFFSPDNIELTTVEIENNAWFVGKEVSEILGYTNHSQTLADHVDEEDKMLMEIQTPAGRRKATMINESGLYSLIFGSQLPSAKKFKHWVTSEVLPHIRKTGYYGQGDITSTVMKVAEDNSDFFLKLYEKATRTPNKAVKEFFDTECVMRDDKKVPNNDLSTQGTIYSAFVEWYEKKFGRQTAISTQVFRTELAKAAGYVSAREMQLRTAQGRYYTFKLKKYEV